MTPPVSTSARSQAAPQAAYALLADGTTVQLREARPADRAAVLRMYEGMTAQHLRYRFFGSGRRVTERSAERICAAGRRGERALLALVGDEVLGSAEFHRDPDHPDTADMAIAVADAWHHRGVGTLLLEHLAHLARNDGLRAFTADALAENTALLELVADIGLHTTRTLDGTEVRCLISLDPDENYLTAVDSRARHADTASLEPLLRPRSVAVVGVGRSPDSVGRALLHNLVEHGFTGSLQAVSRHLATVGDVPVRASVEELPEAPDLAVLAVPAHSLAEVAEQCGRLGVRALLAVSAGLDDTEGAALLNACRTHGMRLVGPNCLGLANTEDGLSLDATFAASAPAAGTAGVAVQSGGVGIALLDALSRLGIGVSTFVSLGDKYDVSGNDLLQWWEGDGRTDMALLHLESFGNPRAFSRTARRLARHMPVLTVDAGRSEAGRRAAATHTAAMATPTVTRQALFTQAGVIAARSLAELTATAALLHSQPLPAGFRVAVVSNAGGAAVLAADALVEAGLTVPELPAPLIGELARVLPGGASATNPVDATAAVTAGQLDRCLRLLDRHGAVDAVLVALVPTAVPAAAGNHPTKVLVPPAGHRSRPVVAVLPGQEATVRMLRTPGTPGDAASGSDAPGATGDRAVPAYADPTTAAAALAHAAGYGRWRARPAGTVPELEGTDPATATALVEEYLDRHPQGGWADPKLCGALLDAYGIAQPPWAWATDEEEAAAAARALGGRIALKASWPGLVHKSDVGAVRLDLDGPEQVSEAFRDLRGTFGDVLAGAVVQPMAPRGTELVAGVVQDEVFGPLVLFGLGGTVTELLADHAARLAPLTDRDVHDLITSPRCAPLLFGYRSGRTAQLPALEGLLHRLSAMACDLPQLAEAEFNPVLAGPTTTMPLDVRIRLLPRAAHDPYLRRLRERPHPGGER
ncbi:GNAT family N-acetyltransferase [Streptomyces sp. 549]|uniref:bifunctional acetate--CoA ligase family protein/GNAT family N-acetyltransferase n=1 Tax=Streptomyces sp. 549 TaxID=3049076 RepID=UPI0024C3D5F4|nr:GNAT family N-acetyltransferase [Streptomyces sp. 549]MDK1472237.1 GNAT family N-acetyltransferase [Streptomyces sp. 549]